MKKLIALFVFLFTLGAAIDTKAQTVIRPDYVQVPNQGYPTHPVLVRNVSPYELEVIVRWAGMKTDYHFGVDAKKDAEVMLPSYVRLNVRAWVRVYDQRGRKNLKEMKFLWYYDEALKKTVFWFPRFK
ncbi:MAG: hypothetical protein HYT67_01415 [Candidatus Yanofskybacteria bacterium]|nr:hypothetical protein [Candidatus Yanofskybacteria bacterium]